MTYKGYTSGPLYFDEEAGLFTGWVQGLRDVVTYSGKSSTELRKAFRDSIEDYLEFCASTGEPPDQPASGRLLLRIGAELHRQLVSQAQAKGTSVNKLVKALLGRQLAKQAGSDVRPIRPLRKKAAKRAVARN